MQFRMILEPRLSVEQFRLVERNDDPGNVHSSLLASINFYSWLI